MARSRALRRLVEATPAKGLVDLAVTHRMLVDLSRVPQVVVAAIDGDACGGGCELALACDIRVMSDGPYRIGLPELSAGIPPGAGGTQRLMAAVGPARARAMVLQAQTLTPQEALAAGLVDTIGSQPLADASAIAEQAAGWNPAAVRAVKRAMRPGHRSGLMREAAGFAAAASGARARQALRDFVSRSDNERGISPWRSPIVTGADRLPATARRPAPPVP